MKKFLSIAVAIVLSLGLVACGGSATGLKDGEYTKEATEFDDSGWKPSSTITVSGGKITSVVWNETNAEGANKKEESESGAYGMVELGGAISEWHEQAALVEAELLKTQDPVQLDEIAGVTVGFDGFKTLSIEALNDAK